MNNNQNIEKLVIVVDMVNGFVKEGPMADKTIGHIIPAQTEFFKKIKNDKKAGIIFIKESHNEYAMEFNDFPKHCVEGTNEAKIIDEYKEFVNDNVYGKNSTSAMFADNFMNDIESLKKLKEIIIVGCCTDICVMNLAIPLKNYLNQINRNVDIQVPMNMVETYDSPNHNRFIYNEMAFRIMGQNGIKLTNKDEYIKYMNQCGVIDVDMKTLTLKKCIK